MLRSETSELSIVNDNILQFGGRSLWADVLQIPEKRADMYEIVSPSRLHAILSAGRVAIHNTIETFYHQQYERLTPKGYTVVRPSIWVAQLGSNEQTDGRDSEVYTAKGYANGGVHFDKDEQHEVFWPHWDAVTRAGFTPHVRGANSGAWLMLRNDNE